MTTPQFTVMVRNFKDDPTGEQVSLHGLFPEVDLAAQFVYDLTVGGGFDFLSADFLSADVIALRPATVASVVEAQRLHPSFLPADHTSETREDR